MAKSIWFKFFINKKSNEKYIEIEDRYMKM